MHIWHTFNYVTASDQHRGLLPQCKHLEPTLKFDNYHLISDSHCGPQRIFFPSAWSALHCQTGVSYPQKPSKDGPKLQSFTSLLCKHRSNCWNIHQMVVKSEPIDIIYGEIYLYLNFDQRKSKLLECIIPEELRWTERTKRFTCPIMSSSQ